MADTDQQTDGGLDEAIAQIDDHILEGDLEAAGDALARAVETHGAHERLDVLGVELTLEAEDYARTVEQADAALETVADERLRGRLLAFKGYAHYYADRIDDARQAFNAAVQAAPELWTAVMGRALVHEYLDFTNAALIDLDRAIAIDDMEAQPFALRGMIRLRRGQLDEAREDLAYALECDPWDEESRLNLARLQALAQRSAEARETLEPLVDEGDDPDFVVPGALLRSQLSLGLGSYEAAEDDAMRAVELDPDRPWGWLQVAACRLTAANPGQAIEALKEAERRMGDVRDYPDLFALRASAYDQLEKPDKAAAERDRAEGAARLPEIVYGEHLNPSANVPVNPNKPIDVRSLMRQIFGDANQAPDGYEAMLRDIVDRIPEFIEQNPNADKLNIELPQIEGMEQAPGNLVIQVNKQRQQG